LAGAWLSKYGRRLEPGGDCPPTALPFDYDQPSFVAAAQRLGRYLHRCWIDQALADVPLQVAAYCYMCSVVIDWLTSCYR